ncbi:hypothetical protein T08_4592 [Trichinella sp. T8]|nr:hypothetical protein T08_4592 [Trichinella sp. T8]
MPDYTAVVSVPPILDFEIVGRPSLSVFTLTHCTGSRKRGVEGVDCSGLGDSGLIGGVTRFYCTLGLRCQKREECLQSRLFLIKLFNSNLPSRLYLSQQMRDNEWEHHSKTRHGCIEVPTDGIEHYAPSSLRCFVEAAMQELHYCQIVLSSGAELSYSTVVSQQFVHSALYDQEPKMPSSRSCCELKKGCFVRYKALDTSRIASVSVTLVHQCVHVIISESYVAVRLFRLFIVLFESFVVGDCPIGRWFESGSEDQKYLKQRTGNETAANEQPGVQIDFTSCVHLSFLLAHIYTCWLNWLCVSWPKSPRRNSVTGLVAQPLDLYDCVVLRNGIVPLCPVPISPNSAPYL